MSNTCCLGTLHGIHPFLDAGIYILTCYIKFDVAWIVGLCVDILDVHTYYVVSAPLLPYLLLHVHVQILHHAQRGVQWFKFLQKIWVGLGMRL